ncbi:siroheme decarboxylase subunit beta [Rhodocyclaceae bacterium SMB388]
MQGHAIASKDFRLLNDWQRDFPLVERPFALLARQVGVTERTVLERFERWQADGVVSRIGAVFATGRVGASALAALAAPPERLAEVAAKVSAVPEVNHNYEREHRFNLWFVITAADARRLDAVVEEIESATGCDVIVLPMEEAHHIDLGFELDRPGSDAPDGGAATNRPRSGRRCDDLSASVEGPCALAGIERLLMRALQSGLPLVPRPYDALGQGIGLSGAMVRDTLDGWQASGVLRRFGVVVRHHELGYTANAMCVWDVPDHRVEAVGRLLGDQTGVTLCYRRRRALPHWPYNLFCMIHGKARDTVLDTRDRIAKELDLDVWPHSILFSGRRFKQRGACYLPEQVDA